MKEKFPGDNSTENNLITIDLEEKLLKKIQEEIEKEKTTKESKISEIIQVFRIYRLIYHLETILEMISRSYPNSSEQEKEVIMWGYAQLIYKKLV